MMKFLSCAALAVGLLPAQDPKPIKPAELKESGDVKVTVKWEGDAPKLRAHDVSGDKYHKHLGEVPNETVIINDNKTLRNVYVRVSKGLEKYTFDAPKTEVVVAINKGRYVPHVAAVMTWQPLTVINEDDHFHSPHKPGGNSPEGSVDMTKKGSKQTFKFASEEVGGRMADDLYDWMECFVHVSAHPYFGVSDDEGVVAIEKLPPGKYTLEAHHEKYGKQTADVTLENGKTAEVTFTYSKGK